jgi:hypothetical protein
MQILGQLNIGVFKALAYRFAMLKLLTKGLELVLLLKDGLLLGVKSSHSLL